MAHWLQQVVLRLHCLGYTHTHTYTYIYTHILYLAVVQTGTVAQQVGSLFKTGWTHQNVGILKVGKSSSESKSKSGSGGGSELEFRPELKLELETA